MEKCKFKTLPLSEYTPRGYTSIEEIMSKAHVMPCMRHDHSIQPFFESQYL